DCLFGTGLKRPLATAAVNRLGELAHAALVSVACDLPSGIDTDNGAELSSVPRFDLTVAFGSLKPAHRLMPAMAHCGRVVLADIGIEASSQWHELGRPFLPGPHPGAHKYSRGMVAVVPGAMPGAAALAATAAARTGAGYVRLDTSDPIANVPAAVVQGTAGDLSDDRIGTILIGPGLGRRGGRLFRKSAGGLLRKALKSGRPMVIDGDALRLVNPDQCAGAILTPHEGEFVALFGRLEGSKAERALAAARRSDAVIVYKGPDTLVASPDGRLGFAPPAPAWLATAGTGDVLAGMIAALRAQGQEAFHASCAAVWLHGRAAEIAGPGLIADDLIDAIPQALALCR
ncbi:MAG TPA: NAD(P)H-hydrate dehydratase, partial [Sphingomicrobium sp.]|nr:NAD(P)H-hydrate dehydratase [Sphingomicrobium sp.]